jgi:hypothetical protein
MPVRLLSGGFFKLDGFAGDDFELVDTGPVTLIPQVSGTGGCVLMEGSFIPREIP